MARESKRCTPWACLAALLASSLLARPALGWELGDPDSPSALDVHGFVSEATVDNLFIVTEHGLVTPPTATNLKGVTRETLMALGASLGIRIDEKPLTLFDVWTAREVFICGTGAEVVPVISVDDRTIGTGGVGPVTSRVSAAYHELVRSQGRAIQPAPPVREAVAGFRV